MSPSHFPREPLAHIQLTGPMGKLESITTWTDNPHGLGIICHPHPLYGGTMNNKVVTAIAKAFNQLGLATVRFNYRGVGQSQGSYGHMQGEVEDLLAVIDWARAVLPNLPIELAGFSFGSFIAASVANQLSDIRQLITVAPAVTHADFQPLTAIHCHWLLIQGDQDEVISYQEVKSFAEHPPVPLTFVTLEGASHFFHGQLIELQKAIIDNVRI